MLAKRDKDGDKCSKGIGGECYKEEKVEVDLKKKKKLGRCIGWFTARKEDLSC